MKVSAQRAADGWQWWGWVCDDCQAVYGSWLQPGHAMTSARLHMRRMHGAWPAPSAEGCRHQSWNLDGNRRTCVDCGTALPDDPARKPRLANPLFIT